MAAGTAGAATEAMPAPKQVKIVKSIVPMPGAKPPADKDLAAYLFVYFKDETHSIHFATSTDSPMKATNFSGPKHGAVMHITTEEL